MIDLELQFPDLPAKLKRNLPKVYLFIAAQMQANRAFLFDAEGAYNGHPKWAPLKFRKGMILSDRGTLRKSIAPRPARGVPGQDGIVRFAGEKVTIGTSLAYAALMNWGTTRMPGGVLRATKAKALKIPIPGGKGATDAAKSLRKGATTIKNAQGKSEKFIFRKSVRIPARRFDEWSNADQTELEEALTGYIAKILRGA